MQKKFSTPSSIPKQRASQPRVRQAQPPADLYERELRAQARFPNKTHPAQYAVFGAVGLCLLLAVFRTLYPHPDYLWADDTADNATLLHIVFVCPDGSRPNAISIENKVWELGEISGLK